MPTITIDWSWEEAFDKFGFDDGDGMVMTHKVELALEKLGYTVSAESWGLHNTIVAHLSKDGKDLLEGVTVGYDDPREYLPDDLVEALDEFFDGAMTYKEAMKALNEAVYTAVRVASSEDGAPVDALRDIAAEVDSLIDHGATRAEVRRMHALYLGSKAAGLV